jgi:hypothetical protein
MSGGSWDASLTIHRPGRRRSTYIGVMSIDSPDGPPEAGCLPEDKPVPRPEDYIGKVIESDLQVDSILAVGSKWVVFKLRNLRTGESDEVMKVWKEEFDPRTPLLEALPQAMDDLSRNPDRVVRVCDRLLALDPTIEAAAFDKGVALLVKEEAHAALDAFSLAVALQPRDILNRVHRAACLAKLERDDGALRDLEAAADLDDAQLKKVLLMVPFLAGDIRQALKRLARTDGSGEPARQVLRAFFGPAMQFRLFLSRCTVQGRKPRLV